MRQLIKRAVSITAISGAVMSMSITASMAAPARAGWRLVVQDRSLSAFQSVAAPGRRDAWAVGYRGSVLVVRHWNGVRWQAVKVPGAAGFFPGVRAGHLAERCLDLREHERLRQGPALEWPHLEQPAPAG